MTGRRLGVDDHADPCPRTCFRAVPRDSLHANIEVNHYRWLAQFGKKKHGEDSRIPIPEMAGYLFRGLRVQLSSAYFTTLFIFSFSKERKAHAAQMTSAKQTSRICPLKKIGIIAG